MTEQQRAWLESNPRYETVGPPRSGVSFKGCGTLYPDGRFVPLRPMVPVKLHVGPPFAICVGRRQPTEEEFAELARKRDEAAAAIVKEVVTKNGWDTSKVQVHHSHSHGCYCACPDGPCQHVWDGPNWESEDRCAVSRTCSRCGAVAMYHDMRCGP